MKGIVLKAGVAWGLLACLSICLGQDAKDLPQVEVSQVRRVFDNGEHNAFTDLTRFRGKYYLTFRSCPDGHSVYPSSSIIVLQSANLKDWRQVHQFQVAQRDTRDPHFLLFAGKLFIYTGTWYCGDSKPDSYDLNQQLGYAVHSADGTKWSQPIMLEGTYGHYIWRAASHAGRAYLCGRRKHEFDARSRRSEGVAVESAMLVSDDGLTWKTHSLFQTENGDETAFAITAGGELVGVGRRGRDAAQLLHSAAPFQQWQREDLDRYLGGPLIVQWGERWVVGGRNNTPDGPRTKLSWLVDGKLIDFAELPSGGDNSYPGFIALASNKALVSWYSSHEGDEAGGVRTAIYTAELTIASRSSTRQKFEFQSTADGSHQAAYLAVPRTESEAQAMPRPLVVSLHSWSGNLEQRQLELEALVAERGWFCLQPDFRGINDHPEACGSELAQQDILDAVEWVQQHYAIDADRVFLTGNSGGGHMTMLMAAKHPQRWAAASAWVGISDLEAWYTKHESGRYGAMMRQCCGGAPEDSPEIREQYRLRSPKYFLSSIGQLPLEIAAGIHDGHSGSVPVRHSLEAFNAIAQGLESDEISEAEIRELAKLNGRLKAPRAGDEGFDENYGREFYLRRQAGNSRVTIFDGGHEGIAEATMAWFDHHY